MKDKMSAHYVSCNLCHELVPEISKETEEAYRFHPACRPEAIAAKEARRLEQYKEDPYNLSYTPFQKRRRK